MNSGGSLLNGLAWAGGSLCEGRSWPFLVIWNGVGLGKSLSSSGWIFAWVCWIVRSSMVVRMNCAFHLACVACLHQSTMSIPVPVARVDSSCRKGVSTVGIAPLSPHSFVYCVSK